MSIKTSLKNLITAMGGTPESKSIKGLLKEIAFLENANPEVLESARSLAEVIQAIAVAKGPSESSEVLGE